MPLLRRFISHLGNVYVVKRGVLVSWARKAANLCGDLCYIDNQGILLMIRQRCKMTNRVLRRGEERERKKLSKSTTVEVILILTAQAAKCSHKSTQHLTVSSRTSPENTRPEIKKGLLNRDVNPVMELDNSKSLTVNVTCRSLYHR